MHWKKIAIVSGISALFLLGLVVVGSILYCSAAIAHQLIVVPTFHASTYAYGLYTPFMLLFLLILLPLTFFLGFLIGRNRGEKTNHKFPQGVCDVRGFSCFAILLNTLSFSAFFGNYVQSDTFQRSFFTAMLYPGGALKLMWILFFCQILVSLFDFVFLFFVGRFWKRETFPRWMKTFAWVAFSFSLSAFLFELLSPLFALPSLEGEIAMGAGYYSYAALQLLSSASFLFAALRKNGRWSASSAMPRVAAETKKEVDSPEERE